MTNEEHIEEMYQLAHTCGVFQLFSNTIIETRKNNLSLSFCDAVEYVFNDFLKKELINPELYLFI